MKLKTLAIAIAMGAMPFAAQADYKVSGDFTVGYFGDADGDNELMENGSEINFDASEKVGGTTFYGHAEFDFNGTSTFSYIKDDGEVGESADTITIEEVYVGAKGAWGDLAIGETDNGCDATDVGGDNTTWMTHTLGGCKGSDANNIRYMRNIGAATVAVSHNPNGSEYNAIGVKGKMGPVTASLGYEAGDNLVDSDGVDHDKNVVLGVVGAFGPVAIGVRANKADSYDKTAYGIHGLYSAGANTFYGGVGKTAAEADSWSVGYNRAIGSNTTFIFEAGEADGDAETSYGVGLKHAF